MSTPYHVGMYPLAQFELAFLAYQEELDDTWLWKIRCQGGMSQDGFGVAPNKKNINQRRGAIVVVCSLDPIDPTVFPKHDRIVAFVPVYPVHAASGRVCALVVRGVTRTPVSYGCEYGVSAADNLKRGNITLLPEEKQTGSMTLEPTPGRVWTRGVLPAMYTAILDLHPGAVLFARMATRWTAESTPNAYVTALAGNQFKGRVSMGFKEFIKREEVPRPTTAKKLLTKLFSTKSIFDLTAGAEGRSFQVSRSSEAELVSFVESHVGQTLYADGKEKKGLLITHEHVDTLRTALPVEYQDVSHASVAGQAPYVPSRIVVDSIKRTLRVGPGDDNVYSYRPGGVTNSMIGESLFDALGMFYAIYPAEEVGTKVPYHVGIYPLVDFEYEFLAFQRDLSRPGTWKIRANFGISQDGFGECPSDANIEDRRGAILVVCSLDPIDPTKFPKFERIVAFVPVYPMHAPSGRVCALVPMGVTRTPVSYGCEYGVPAGENVECGNITLLPADEQTETMALKPTPGRVWTRGVLPAMFTAILDLYPDAVLFTRFATKWKAEIFVNPYITALAEKRFKGRMALGFNKFTRQEEITRPTTVASVLRATEFAKNNFRLYDEEGERIFNSFKKSEAEIVSFMSMNVGRTVYGSMRQEYERKITRELVEKLEEVPPIKYRDVEFGPVDFGDTGAAPPPGVYVPSRIEVDMNKQTVRVGPGDDDIYMFEKGGITDYVISGSEELWQRLGMFVSVYPKEPVALEGVMCVGLYVM
jgi:hypothetical protein